MAVETARDHAMHRLRHPQQQPARLSLSSEFRKYACTGARHMRASEPPEPGQMLRHFGVQDDALHRQDLARLYTGFEIARYTTLRTAAVLEAGGQLGPWTATAKLHLANHLNWAASFVSTIDLLM